jgi:hypothetical protein
MDPRANLSGVLVFQGVENAQGVLPCQKCLLRLTCLALGVAEVSQDRGFEELVAELAEVTGKEL